MRSKVSRTVRVASPRQQHVPCLLLRSWQMAFISYFVCETNVCGHLLHPPPPGTRTKRPRRLLGQKQRERHVWHFNGRLVFFMVYYSTPCTLHHLYCRRHLPAHLVFIIQPFHFFMLMHISSSPLPPPSPPRRRVCTCTFTSLHNIYCSCC